MAKKCQRLKRSSSATTPSSSRGLCCTPIWRIQPFLSGSDTRPFAAEIYKSFLLCAARILKNEGGTITAYDGDRVMAVFIGGSKNTSAARSALKINWAMQKIVQPALKKQYPSKNYIPRHVVGIDTSDLYVARTGVRGDNDLVWVGRAANYAAKLSALSESYRTYATEAAYDNFHKSAKYSKEGDGESMWVKLIWTEFDGSTIYGSTWRWGV